MSEESMPSKRMVPAQQLSDVGEDLVRLAAAKDAEIAALTADKERLGENYRGCVEERAEARAQVAALTAERNSFRNGWTQAHNRAAALTNEIAALTEQRDRAMAVVDAARRANRSLKLLIAEHADPGAEALAAEWELSRALHRLAALDAEAAAEKGT